MYKIQKQQQQHNLKEYECSNMSLSNIAQNLNKFPISETQHHLNMCMGLSLYFQWQDKFIRTNHPAHGESSTAKPEAFVRRLALYMFSKHYAKFILSLWMVLLYQLKNGASDSNSLDLMADAVDELGLYSFANVVYKIESNVPLPFLNMCFIDFNYCAQGNIWINIFLKCVLNGNLVENFKIKLIEPE